MKEIKGLFDEINFNSIPRTIYNRLAQIDSRSYSISDYGLQKPFLVYLVEHDCYIIVDHYNKFERNINKGLIDENNVEIKGNKNIIYNLLNEYGNGFRKGYNDFDNLVKPDDNLFKLENNQIAFKVFSEIDTVFNIAGFTYTFGVNTELKITKKLMFESGYKWGKKYRAWEIILNNVPLFEPFFEKFKPSETINELIDNSKDLPEIELKFTTEQIRLLYDLGVIDFLQNKFKATLKGNNSQTAKLISQILKEKHSTVQPTINSLLTNTTNKNYPTQTPKTKAIIDKLNANELK